MRVCMVDAIAPGPRDDWADSVSALLPSARDKVRSQLWPLPVLGVVVAVLAGVLIPELDTRLDDQLPRWFSAALFGGDAGAARTLLDAIASSLITVTSLTFSLTVVTLQLASSQFSPRLLRTFASDVFVQATLAIFLATFTYALTVLRAVRSGDDRGSDFVPRISVTVAFLLAIASVLGLVLFLAHLVRQIRVETMLRDVHQDAIVTVHKATRPIQNAEPSRQLPTAPTDADEVTGASSGFLTSIDGPGLCAAATEADAHLIIWSHPGSSVIEGVPIGVTWSAHGPLAQDRLSRMQNSIARCIKVGHERTAAQDVSYGLRQLTDVANKALSPGINDPTTAIHALGHISALLCQLADRDLGPVTLCDGDGLVRVVLRRPGFADLLDVAISQPRRYGSSDAQVMARLFRLLEEVAWRSDDVRSVSLQLDRLVTTVGRSDLDATEVAELEQLRRRVEAVLARPSGPTAP